MGLAEEYEPNSDGLQPNSNGLQPTSDGLQPTSDVCILYIGTMAYLHTDSYYRLAQAETMAMAYKLEADTECSVGSVNGM